MPQVRGQDQRSSFKAQEHEAWDGDHQENRFVLWKAVAGEGMHTASIDKWLAKAKEL